MQKNENAERDNDKDSDKGSSNHDDNDEHEEQRQEQAEKMKEEEEKEKEKKKKKEKEKQEEPETKHEEQEKEEAENEARESSGSEYDPFMGGAAGLKHAFILYYFLLYFIIIIFLYFLFFFFFYIDTTFDDIFVLSNIFCCFDNQTGSGGSTEKDDDNNNGDGSDDENEDDKHKNKDKDSESDNYGADDDTESEDEKKDDSPISDLSDSEISKKSKKRNTPKRKKKTTPGKQKKVVFKSTAEAEEEEQEETVQSTRNISRKSSGKENKKVHKRHKTDITDVATMNENKKQSKTNEDEIQHETIELEGLIKVLGQQIQKCDSEEPHWETQKRQLEAKVVNQHQLLEQECENWKRASHITVDTVYKEVDIALERFDSELQKLLREMSQTLLQVYVANKANIKQNKTKQTHNDNYIINELMHIRQTKKQNKAIRSKVPDELKMPNSEFRIELPQIPVLAETRFNTKRGANQGTAYEGEFLKHGAIDVSGELKRNVSINSPLPSPHDGRRTPTGGSGGHQRRGSLPFSIKGLEIPLPVPHFISNEIAQSPSSQMFLQPNSSFGPMASPNASKSKDMLLPSPMKSVPSYEMLQKQLHMMNTPEFPNIGVNENMFPATFELNNGYMLSPQQSYAMERQKPLVRSASVGVNDGGASAIYDRDKYASSPSLGHRSMSFSVSPQGKDQWIPYGGPQPPLDLYSQIATKINLIPDMNINNNNSNNNNNNSNNKNNNSNNKNNTSGATSNCPSPTAVSLPQISKLSWHKAHTQQFNPNATYFTDDGLVVVTAPAIVVADTPITADVAPLDFFVKVQATDSTGYWCIGIVATDHLKFLKPTEFPPADEQFFAIGYNGRAYHSSQQISTCLGLPIVSGTTLKFRLNLNATSPYFGCGYNDAEYGKVVVFDAAILQKLNVKLAKSYYIVVISQRGERKLRIGVKQK
ncbi:hypothetical protein RFI_08453 [Reticulomyxa filosa]|uniref:Uncharacterized protein n=1 Tax=Reticulomyxa filosa TaxID=46433 RepID=X6NTQ5_RETFI|nr:hypothetical protein RFI_08453 [Reticulomyxa filosa]|eukprot:ETO28677.1 hypothetical protein RFI_08453 [Reticulomyxa filosa]